MSGTDTSGKCKDFVTASEIEERRKKRQEEWEKVRKPEDPLEAPEEEYDPKSLYERLQEQKDKRQAEFEESHRLKNLIKGLDDDEVAFLELVDKTKIDIETKVWQEEVKEIQEFKKAVAHLSEVESDAKLQELRKSIKLQRISALKKSQQDLLAKAVKRKASNGSTSQEKRHCPTQDSENSSEIIHSSSPSSSNNEVDDRNSSPTEKAKADIEKNTKSLHCYGILPGLGAYSDSSDSENSSNSDVELEKGSNEFDLIGRKRSLIVINSTGTMKNLRRFSIK